MAHVTCLSVNGTSESIFLLETQINMPEGLQQLLEAICIIISSLMLLLSAADYYERHENGNLSRLIFLTFSKNFPS